MYFRLKGEHAAMRVEDALRKIRLLRRLIPANGASEAEAETATRLAQTLMERYCIKIDDVRPIATPSPQMTWVYWEHLLAEFGMSLESFGRRASVRLANGALIVIRLAANQWHVQHPSSDGWKIMARDFGVESLRVYLAEHGPRSYSLAG
jgi:hypothetical protein